MCGRPALQGGERLDDAQTCPYQVTQLLDEHVHVKAQAAVVQRSEQMPPIQSDGV